ncbi:MAG: GNAT family N-acetyltransferase [Desulfobacteraceae bacterium]|nr:MAG: GNAT family N-acetyltransferase [Desulfobacteraceae bacterium]
MDIIQLTPDNVEQEHICCAISDKKCAHGYAAKKQWLSNQISNGFTFKKLNVRGKVFIEYLPAEYAWAPVDAPDYMMVNCFWVSGRYKGQGHGKALYDECVKDAAGKSGIIVLTSGTKQPFLSERKFFEKQGFSRCDTAPPYFELWHLKLGPDAPTPRFRTCVKSATCGNPSGLTVYYSSGCPYTDYYANTEMPLIAGQLGKPLTIIHLDTRRKAQNHCIPYTNYSIFNNGEFVTHQILTRKNAKRFIPQ